MHKNVNSLHRNPKYLIFFLHKCHFFTGLTHFLVCIAGFGRGMKQMFYNDTFHKQYINRYYKRLLIRIAFSLWSRYETEMRAITRWASHSREMGISFSRDAHLMYSEMPISVSRDGHLAQTRCPSRETGMLAGVNYLSFASFIVSCVLSFAISCNAFQKFFPFLVLYM
jgi:hypothetical protein